MEEWRNIYIVLTFVLIGIGFTRVHAENHDFSGPIKCFYCLGRLDNSSCSDPVDPRHDRHKSLEVIDCEHGICIKWTHLWNKGHVFLLETYDDETTEYCDPITVLYTDDVRYMHRTCSARTDGFRIMMIDGVCRSERMGKGELCMCGKHLCNGGHTLKIELAAVVTILTSVISLMKFTSMAWSL